MSLAMMRSIPGGACARSCARLATSGLLLLTLVACATSSFRAPVEDRSVFNRPSGAAMVSASTNASASVTTASAGAITSPVSPVAPPEPVKAVLGHENAGKPGFYTVKAGDTLIRVGLETGQSWKDIIKWNNLDNPNVIEAGQVLRVVAPGADPNAVSTRPVSSVKLESRPLDAPKAPVAAVVAPVAPVVVPPVPPLPREGDDEMSWLWPASGPVIGSFDEVRSKGISIAGKAGDPVLASAEGKVVYAGSGLRGYGNLVIIKHNSIYLTAYAHNQTLLVKEEQSVKRGQKIAEMGSSDAERVQLHFEIRKQGKPVDPARLLPSR